MCCYLLGLEFPTRNISSRNYRNSIEVCPRAYTIGCLESVGCQGSIPQRSALPTFLHEVEYRAKPPLHGKNKRLSCLSCKIQASTFSSEYGESLVYWKGWHAAEQECCKGASLVASHIRPHAYTWQVSAGTNMFPSPAHLLHQTGQNQARTHPYSKQSLP